MNKDKILNKISLAGFWAVGTFIAGCGGCVIGVISDSTVWEVIGGILVIGSLIAMVAGIVASLLHRQWLKAFGGFCAIVLCMAVGFFAAIVIGAGQHHPPKQAEAVAPTWSTVMADTTLVKMLPVQLAKGSQWTDGEYFYTVVGTGSTLFLEGMTLHEGGMDMTLEEHDGELFVIWKDNDLATFGYDGEKVIHLELLKEYSGKSLELLMICDEEGNPTQVLQRYAGDEQEFAKRQLYAVLDGVYNDTGDGRQQWLFSADGTLAVRQDVGSKDAPDAKAYDFEEVYHSPTNVIHLADDKRWGISRDMQELIVTKPVYDDVEAYWQSSNDTVMVLKRTETNDAWYKERIFTPGMTTLLSRSTLSALLQENHSDENPVSILNCHLIEHFIEHANKQAVEADESEEEEVG